MSVERIETNRLLLDYLDLWDDFLIKSTDKNKTKKYYNIISQLVDNQIKETVDFLNSEEAKKLYYEDVLYNEGLFNKLAEKWDVILDSEYDTVEKLIEAIYDEGHRLGYKDMEARARFTNADIKALGFVKDYNFNLIRNLDFDLRNAIKRRMTIGIAEGKNPYALADDLVKMGVEPLPGSTLSPKQRAVMIAKTEVSRAQNTGILQAYAQEGYTQVTILTAEDNNVCTLCLKNAYEFNEDDQVIFENAGDDVVHDISKMNKNSWVPLHPNCRCTYLAVWETKEKRPVEPPVVNLTDGLAGPLDEKVAKADKEKEFDKLTDPQEIADYFKYEFSENDSHLIFKDVENNLELLLSKDIKFGNGNILSVKDAVRLYHEKPVKLKEKTNKIEFTNNGPFGVNGECFYAVEGRPIKIYPPSFNEGIDSVSQTMSHEMGHALDNKSKKSWASTSRRGKNNYRAALRADFEYQDKQGLTHQDVSKYGQTNIMESFAEAVSYSTQTNMDALMNHPLPDGTRLTIGEWQARYPNVVKYIKNLLKL